MGLTTAQIKRDGSWVFKDFPTETISIDSADYECLVLDQSKGNDWGEGGLMSEVVLRVAIERDKIGTIPTQGTLATIGTSTYRIGRVEQDDEAAPITIDLTHNDTR